MLLKFKALSVHLLTALGVVCALFALRATFLDQPEQGFLWLGVAFVIDGVDGFFARRYDVKSVLPLVDGETLDLCVDYITYVFVPVLMLLAAAKLTGVAGFMLAGLICVTALYHFADLASKTDDHCFIGFPAIWNVVAFYIFAMGLSGWAMSALIVLCCGLTFVPWKWVHPMRVQRLRTLTLVCTAAWAMAAVMTLRTGFPATPVLRLVLLIVAAYGTGLSLMFGRGRR